MRTKTLTILMTLIIMSCNNDGGQNNFSQRSKYEVAIDNLLAQCKEFDAAVLSQNLPGEWMLDSSLKYDSNWDKITNVDIFFGIYFTYADSNSDDIKYSFNADGSGTYIFTYPYPPYEEESLTFTWQYDATNRMLVLSGELNRQFKVSGFTNEYIILDFVINDQNTRQILKKVE